MEHLSFFRMVKGNLEFDLDEIKKLNPQHIDRLTEVELKVLLNFLVELQNGVIEKHFCANKAIFDLPQKEICEEVWIFDNASDVEDDDLF